MVETAQQADILVVDDKPENLQLLIDMLGHQGYKVRPVISGSMAFMAIDAAAPDLILLDVDMPEMDGYEVCAHIKADRALRDIPVIFVSALNETFDKVRGFAVGGVDYITKPFHFEEVIARIQAHLSLAEQQRVVKDQFDMERAMLEKLNEMKSEQVRYVAHDIKTQISAIYAALDLIRSERNLTDLQTQYVDFAHAAAEKMFTNMVDLLNYMQSDDEVEVSLRDVELNRFLRRIANEFVVTAQHKRIDYAYLPLPEEVVVQFDPGAMRQVVYNLISNAIKYTPDGGRVQMSVELYDDALVIRIRDTGLGIPREDLPRIFNRAYRVKTARHQAIEGTGMGLNIVKTIVEQHGGEIKVYSVLEEGTTFEVVLPR